MTQKGRSPPGIDHGHQNEGDVRDARVTAHLRRLRDRRELGRHAWAVGELARFVPEPR